MSEADDVAEYRAAMRSWLAANLEPRAAAASLRAGHAISADQLAADRAVQRTIFEAGYMGITLPVEYGGQGLTKQHQRVWTEESARYAVPTPGGIAMSVTLGIVLPTLLAHGSEHQKQEWIPRMLSAEEIWVQLLSEPGAGSDLAGVLTRAVPDGDAWRITGTKLWSSGAMSADYGVCLARTDWDTPKHRGVTWFKVPLHDERVTVRPVREINGSSEFCEEFLDDVVVGSEMVIGEVNNGWGIANTMLAVERSGTPSRPASATDAASGLAPDLVELARAAGLANDGATRQLIAGAHIADWAHRQLTSRVLEATRAGAVDASATSLIKLSSGLVQPARAAAAMEIAGRRGVAWSPEGDDRFRAAAVNFLNGRIMSIAGGSNQIQRNIISERLLGLPREPSVDADKPFREVLRDAKAWGRKPG